MDTKMCNVFFSHVHVNVTLISLTIVSFLFKLFFKSNFKKVERKNSKLFRSYSSACHRE
jgi:hypothetical protein